MCSVIGFTADKLTKENFNIFYNLILQSKIRGLHSFGLSYQTPSGIQTKKWLKFPDPADIAKELTNIDGEVNVIYHNRYSTSGDFHKAENNQPLVNIECTIAVAVNGVITMAPRKEWEALFEVPLITENDAEIFLSVLNHEGLKPAQEFVKEMPGSFAGVFIYEGKVYVLRNNRRPLWCFKHANSVFISSTKDIIDRVYFGSKFDTQVVPAYELRELNEF